MKQRPPWSISLEFRFWGPAWVLVLFTTSPKSVLTPTVLGLLKALHHVGGHSSTKIGERKEEEVAVWVRNRSGPVPSPKPGPRNNMMGILIESVHFCLPGSSQVGTIKKDEYHMEKNMSFSNGKE